MNRLALLLLPIVFIAGCGGGSDQAATPAPAPTPPSVPTNPGGGGVAAPTVVTVAAGTTASGVNITVPTAAGTLNAELLGTTEIGQGGSAGNTGGQIPRGTSRRVIIFGAGITGDEQIIIGGPADVTVGNVAPVRSTSGKPGISFDATAGAGASLGARTVYLKAGNNDITAFAGGLEVVP